MYNRFGMPYNNPIPDKDRPKRGGGGLGALVQAEKLIQIAFVLPCAMVIGWLLGAWADRSLHQSWISIAGVIFGCVSGLFTVIRMAMAAEKGSAPDTAGDADKKDAGQS